MKFNARKVFPVLYSGDQCPIQCSPVVYSADHFPLQCCSVLNIVDQYPRTMLFSTVQCRSVSPRSAVQCGTVGISMYVQFVSGVLYNVQCCKVFVQCILVRYMAFLECQTSSVGPRFHLWYKCLKCTRLCFAFWITRLIKICYLCFFQ